MSGSASSAGDHDVGSHGGVDMYMDVPMDGPIMVKFDVATSTMPLPGPLPNMHQPRPGIHPALRIASGEARVNRVADDLADAAAGIEARENEVFCPLDVTATATAIAIAILVSATTKIPWSRVASMASAFTAFFGCLLRAPSRVRLLIMIAYRHYLD